MGVSTDGQICYGVLIEEDAELPWDAEPHNGDLQGWWATTQDSKAAHECPVQLMNACSDECSVWLLTDNTTFSLIANRGYPQSFDPTALTATKAQRSLLLDFCQTHSIDIGDEEPRWYLSSYYG